MGARYLTDMLDVLLRAGIDATSQEGWQTRGRSSGGFDGDRPWAIMWHHAASAPDATTKSVADYATYGSDSPPVCNLVLGRAGDVIVCAAGATNTNGKGGPLTVSRGTIPLDMMNTHGIGIEAVNTGVGEPWPQVQIDAYFTINNALANAYGLDPTDCCTHAGWVEPSCPGRKIDPATASAVEGPWQPSSINTSGTWSLFDVRAEALARYTPPAPPPEEPDMPITFIAAAPGYATVLVAIDGAGTSLMGFATEADQNSIITAAGNPPIVHVTAAQMIEITSRAAAGDTS